MNVLGRNGARIFTGPSSFTRTLSWTPASRVGPTNFLLKGPHKQSRSALNAKLQIPGCVSVTPLQFRKFSSEAESSSSLSKEHFDKLVKNNKIVVFMKGVPDEPRCGFSNAVVQILRMHGVDNYDSHNVLADENIRQGIKEYTNWPTIPQIFINGEFVGGCDILIEMHKNGELVEQLSKVGIKSALLEDDSGKK